MRKGADCLSKWVGESERQLRLLFDQVRKNTFFKNMISLYVVFCGVGSQMYLQLKLNNCTFS